MAAMYAAAAAAAGHLPAGAAVNGSAVPVSSGGNALSPTGAGGIPMSLAAALQLQQQGHHGGPAGTSPSANALASGLPTREGISC